MHLDAPPRIHGGILFVEFGDFFVVFDDVHALEVVAYVVAIIVIRIYNKTSYTAKHGRGMALLLFTLDRGIVRRGYRQGDVARHAAFDNIGVLGYPPYIADGNDALVVGHAKIGYINLVSGRICTNECHVVTCRSHRLHSVSQNGECRTGNIIVAQAFDSGGPYAVDAAVHSYLVILQFFGYGIAICHLAFAIQHHDLGGCEVISGLWCNHDVAHDDISTNRSADGVCIPVYCVRNLRIVIAVNAEHLSPDSRKAFDVRTAEVRKFAYGIMASGNRCGPKAIISVHTFFHKHDDMVVHDGYAIYALAEDARLGHFVAAVVKYDQAEVGANINLSVIESDIAYAFGISQLGI